jgi:hypothetical protein
VASGAASCYNASMMKLGSPFVTSKLATMGDTWDSRRYT